MNRAMRRYSALQEIRKNANELVATYQKEKFLSIKDANVIINPLEDRLVRRTFSKNLKRLARRKK